MSANNVLIAVNAAIAVLDLVEQIGGDVQRLVALREQAKTEGRPISAEELKQLSDSARQAVSDIVTE